MPANSIIDNDYKENHTKNYHLSIQVNLDGFSFIIKDPSTEKILYFYENTFTPSASSKMFSDWLKGELMKHKVLRYDFANTSCYVQSSNYTIIPSHLFIREQAKSLLEVNAPVRQLDEIHFNDLPSLHAVLIFTVHTEVASLLSTHIACCIIQCTVKNQIKALAETENTHQINVQVNSRSIDVVLLECNKLVLINNYLFTSDNDIVYHLLNIIKQFDLKQEEYAITLQGKINRFGNLYKLIERFIPNVNMATTTSIKAPLGLNPSLKSSYYSLLVS